MNSGKICVSVCAESTDQVLNRIHRAETAGADVIEIRFDCLEELAGFESLIDCLPEIPATYLFTFRPKEQGGHRETTLRDRLKFWERAHQVKRETYFLVDYEFDLLLRLQPDGERLIYSYHDFQGTPGDLEERIETFSGLSGATLKVAVMANDICDTVRLWQIFEKAKDQGRRMIPIAMGEAGKWTRVLGLAHGASITYASLESGSQTAPGQISVDDLNNLYRVRELDRSTDVYGIIAGDTSYSVSPYLHNAAFRTARLNCVFVPLQVADLGEFIRRMVEPETREIDLNFKGFSVTNPHKQAIIRHLDEVDESAREIGAVNTVKIVDGRLHGYNTDAEGFIRPLTEAFGSLDGGRVAVVGAGGAARACIYSLMREGADITVFARNRSKAADLISDYNAWFQQLTIDENGSPRTDFAGFDILVNTTPLGTRGQNENKTIAAAEHLSGVKLVYDLTYNPIETRLLSEAGRAGCAILGGLDMLIGQGARQFEIWTGLEAPLEAMRRSVTERLGL